MSDSHMHEADASSAEAEASFSAPSDAAAPDFLRFEPPAELIETAPLVSSSLGSSLGRTRHPELSLNQPAARLRSASPAA